MKELLGQRVTLACDRALVWDIVDDLRALARVLPGCESLTSAADGSLLGVLSARLAFITVRADVVARLVDRDPPRSMRIEIEGRPKALAGSFRASIPFTLDSIAPGQTALSYRVLLSVTGRLATFGAPLLRDAMCRQVQDLVVNLEREAAMRAAPGPGPDR